MRPDITAPGPELPSAPESAGSVELRYRLLVEQIPAITYIADVHGDRPFLYVSPQAEELLGYPADLWVSDPDLWPRILHPEDRDRVLAEEQRTLAAQETFESQYRLVAADGHVVWIWERDTLVRDEQGRLVCTQGVLMDVTDLKHTQFALSESESLVREERDRAQRYLDVAATMIVVLDTEGRATLLNRRACEVLGYADGEIEGQDWFDAVLPQGDREESRAVFGQLINGDLEGADKYENHVVAKSGEQRLIRWQNTLLYDEHGAVTGTLSSGEDVTDRERAQRREVYLAFHDQLTGLPNRAMLSERLAVVVSRAQHTGASAALICLDVDDFKLVNDSLGHAVGDELLTAVSKRLGRLKRHNDMLARTGGDEFFLLLPDLPEGGESAALFAAQRIGAVFQDPFEVAGTELHVSASIGMSLFPRDSADADELLQARGRRDVPGQARLARRASPSTRPTARIRSSAYRSPPGCASRLATASWCSTTSRSSRSPTPGPWRYRGAHPLERSRPRARAAQRLHPRGRGQRTDRADRRMGGGGALPPGRRVADPRPASRGSA